MSSEVTTLIVFANKMRMLLIFCGHVGSNRDYMIQCFRQNATPTFSDNVNRLRVDFMAEE